MAASMYQRDPRAVSRIRLARQSAALTPGPLPRRFSFQRRRSSRRKRFVGNLMQAELSLTLVAACQTVSNILKSSLGPVG